MAIAFFDFDKTLIRCNSGTLWLRHELRSGAMPWSHAARAAWLLGCYRMGIVELEAGLRFAIRTLEGRSEAELRDRVQRFYRAEVQHHYRPKALAELEHRRRQGARVVLLTSASVYLSEAVQQHLELDGILCNRFEVGPDGRFTGQPDGDLCYGRGKRVLAERFAREAGESLEDATFYTDSMADLPALEAVGRPVVVNPDPRLGRQARLRGWDRVNWD